MGRTPLGRPHPLDADPQGKPLDADPPGKPLDADPPGVGQTPPQGLGRPPQGWADPPPELGRPPWIRQTPLDADPPLGWADPLPIRYGQQAGSTHPTGMHTCLFIKSSKPVAFVITFKV